ncbi:MAG: ATP synthase F0 subunit B [Candidatus Eremiobacteraeota bacterium]|nr:ATP synthase F0 subunit B [Candidatus Eremiobacteraeota bacterium]
MNYEAIATWSQVISSVLFIGVLIWLFRRFGIPLVMAAQKAKNDEIALAERRRNDAKAALESLQARAGNAEADAKAIRERAAAQAQRERQATVAQANEAGERVLHSAQGELERARAAARTQLLGELASGALALARTEAAERIDPERNAKIVGGFLRFVERRAQN